MNTLLLGQISKFRALRKPFVLHIPYYTTLSKRFTNQHSCKLSQQKVIGGYTMGLIAGISSADGARGVLVGMGIFVHG